MTPFLKPFDKMTRADYEQIGLKAGLEIHQQLLTEKKLFCRCPAGHYSEKFDAEILRHMRPTLSELGEYDGTALMEFKTKKEIIYQINHETVCTYEMDDTPPFEVNPQALDTALEIAMLMNYKLVSEIHIARKQYLDGSIPTGFQRTTIVGIDGWIPYKDRKIGLIQLGLEEDACREVSDIGHERVYLTDRLGMPLIETVTEPVLYTPQEVAEVANILRWLVRSTGKVRTGIGAGRQDVNVSITGGTRIEIKGVARIPLIPLLIYNEALRQYSLLKIREELKNRGITRETFVAENAEVSSLLSRTSWEPIKAALGRGEEIHCVKLKGFLGLLSTPTQSGKVFSKEISDRVRVVACLTRLPNILTSESTEETIDSFIWNKIRKSMKATSHDALILVWGPKKDMPIAVEEIIIRAREATIGIPSETRQALPDGTNGFERILPGADRMYPDTDLPPLEITAERIKKLQVNVPVPLWEREQIYREMNIPKHLITPIASSPKAKQFEKIVESFAVSPIRVARYLFETAKNWKRKKLPVGQLDEKFWNVFFEYAEKQPVLLEAGEEIIESCLNGQETDFVKAVSQLVPARVDSRQLDVLIDEAVGSVKGNNPPAHKVHRYLMGRLMDTCRGQIPGKQVSERLSQKLQQDGGHND